MKDNLHLSGGMCTTDGGHCIISLVHSHLANSRLTQKCHSFLFNHSDCLINLCIQQML